MNTSRHWDDEVERGFEHRAERHDKAYQRAQAYAARRTAFWEEFVRYLGITLLLLWIVRPVGVVVAICWGIKLWSRYSRLHVAPKLREHWTKRELERRAQRTPRRHSRQRGGRGQGERSEAEDLLERVGDDPDSSVNLRLAKEALADAESFSDSDSGATEAAPAQGTIFNVADVLEQTLAKQRERLEHGGIGLSVEFDSVGRIRADARQLATAFREVLESAIDSLEASQTPQPRIEVEMGENLARTQVWVRIRHNGAGLGSRDDEEIILSKNGEEQA
jgi:hypothetical protein